MRSKINRIRKFKYYFFKYGIHHLLPGKKLKFLGHLSTLSKWISDHKDLAYTDFPSKNFVYNNRYGLYEFIINTELQNQSVDYLEFGVSTGNSFRWWVENYKNEDSRFYGFDTFTGLPEDWGPFKKGDMSNGNEPPVIDDNRHKFYQGLFQTTLYEFLETFQSDKKKVIHLDADLYTATLFVLTTLAPYLNKGDILLFDEFNVPNHEYKAFIEWVDSFYINYEVLGQVNNYYQVAMRLV